MKEAITVMSYTGNKSKGFLHNLKNIICVEAQPNVKNTICVQENPNACKEKQCGLGHLLQGQTSLKQTPKMSLWFLLLHQG